MNPQVLSNRSRCCYRKHKTAFCPYIENLLIIQFTFMRAWRVHTFTYSYSATKRGSDAVWRGLLEYMLCMLWTYDLLEFPSAYRDVVW